MVENKSNSTFPVSTQTSYLVIFVIADSTSDPWSGGDHGPEASSDMCSVFRSDSRVNEGKKKGIFPLWSCLVLSFHKPLSRSRHFGFKTRLDGQPRVKSKMAAASYSSSGFECSCDDFYSLLTFHALSWKRGSGLLQHKLVEEQLSSRQNSIIYTWKTARSLSWNAHP